MNQLERMFSQIELKFQTAMWSPPGIVQKAKKTSMDIFDGVENFIRQIVMKNKPAISKKHLYEASNTSKSGTKHKFPSVIMMMFSYCYSWSYGNFLPSIPFHFFPIVF